MPSTEQSSAGTTKAPPRASLGVDQCWHVAVICAMTTFLTNATIRSSGFLYIGIMNEFQVGRGEAAWPICLMGAMANIAGLVAGPLCQKYTPPPVTFAGSIIMCCGIVASSFAPTITWLTVTQGIVFGVGSGLVLMTLPLYINQHFEKYRGFALGITYAGSTSSAFVFPRLLLYLEETYNFRSSVMIFGAIVSNVTAASLLLKEPSWIRRQRVEDALALKRAKDIYTIEKEVTKAALNSTSFVETSGVKNVRNTHSDEKNPLNPWSIRHGLTVLENPMFYAVMLTYIVFGYNFDVFMATIVDFAIDKGTALEAAVGLIPLFSMTDTLGRLFIPLLVDRGHVTRSCLATVTYLWMSFVLFGFPLVSTYYEILAACMCLSMAIGCSVTMYPALMADYMGLQRLPISYGIVGTVAGPLFLLKPLFIGYFRDHVGCYSNMYRFLSGGVFLLGLVWLAVFLRERRKRKEWQPQPIGATDAIIVAGHAIYCNPGFAGAAHGPSAGCCTADGVKKFDLECGKACK
ncbi:monocarboxylate transporter 9-like [Dermacentor albipictus]|uniref:monocarboxylate transporter 9-like n=1 Tax=Dermacentor albipictus TaxID=60249 RepID=UPI0031FC354A